MRGQVTKSAALLENSHVNTPTPFGTIPWGMCHTKMTGSLSTIPRQEPLNVYEATEIFGL